ncbi:MAG: hypothetical protein A2039_08750 [Candidatus Melainabacteria bacterium GWA2_34_9]|nr:MAG: hypothetical protein A2039_08750 [Candidatus Melainabacteria bacterium GWA2_34_9]
MTNLLEKNLNYLSKYNLELAEKIRNHNNLEANYEINPAKSGDSILYKNNIPVDDSMDPVWNALESYSKLEFKSIRSITVLLGIGLGYTFKEFSKRYEGKIILHEPNLEFLRIAFEFVDFSEELSKKNIMITHTHDDLKAAYKILFFRGYKFNFLPSNYYLIEDNANLQEFTNKINNNHGLFEQNYNNLWKKNYLWTTLLFQDIPYVVNNQDMHVLKDKFKNKPAVILSAGPSLDKNIENLKPYRDKVVVFCVGVAFKTAVKHGIIPDFVAVIDNKKEIIDIPEIADVNLIASTNTFEGIFELKPKRFFNHHNKNTPACVWLAKVLGITNLDEYETAGTVAINCLYTAKLMGCDKIILVGQDLAYTDNKCYSKNSAHAGFSVSESKTIEFEGESNKTEEALKNQKEFLNKDLLYVKGLNGKNLLTRPDYYTFILYFEEIAEKYASEIKLINATEGGAYLKGYEHITLKEALEKNTDAKINVDEALKDTQLTALEISKRNKKVLKELKSMITNYNDAKKIIDFVFKKAIAPYLNFNFKVLYNYIKINSYWNIFLKAFKNPNSLLNEEKIILSETIKLSIDFSENLRKNIKNLLIQNPRNFSNSLKIMKDNYFKIKEILSLNPYYKMSYLTSFLDLDNQIKDFENNDENLIELSYQINSLYLNLYYYGSIFNEKIIAKLIDKLEKSEYSRIQ